MDAYIQKLAKRYPVRAKIILGLSAGAILGFTRLPNSHMRMLREFSASWKEIDRRALRRHLYGLEKEGFVKRIKKKNNEIYFKLTSKGVSMTGRSGRPSSRKRIWDNKWRIIVFDIPENERKKRDKFRRALVELGFVELQHSVWIYPHECYEEIYGVADVLEISDYLSYIVAEKVSRENLLKKQFKV